MALAAAPYPDEVAPRRKPNLKTVEDAAREIGVSRPTVFRWLERGWLKRYYISLGARRTAVDMAEVRELLRNPPGEPADK